MIELQCPKCKGEAQVEYPEVVCLRCHYSEPMIDFPVSWDWHRHYTRSAGQQDPGPCYTHKQEIPAIEVIPQLVRGRKQPATPTRKHTEPIKSKQIPGVEL